VSLGRQNRPRKRLVESIPTDLEDLPGTRMPNDGGCPGGSGADDGHAAQHRLMTIGYLPRLRAQDGDVLSKSKMHQMQWRGK
jgi:hypothetical protein